MTIKGHPTQFGLVQTGILQLHKYFTFCGTETPRATRLIAAAWAGEEERYLSTAGHIMVQPF